MERARTEKPRPRDADVPTAPRARRAPAGGARLAPVRRAAVRPPLPDLTFALESPMCRAETGPEPHGARVRPAPARARPVAADRAAPAARSPGPAIAGEGLVSFKAGTHRRLYEVLGAHRGEADGESGVWFAVWAPGAESVTLIGDFNRWDLSSHPMSLDAASGVWRRFVPALAPGMLYKYHVRAPHEAHGTDKADPFAFRSELPPRTASVVWDLSYRWSDSGWMTGRAAAAHRPPPMKVGGVDLAAWGRSGMGCRAAAAPLLARARKDGLTHLSLGGVMEHMDDAPGITGHFAPTSRCGTPQDLMAMIDRLHREGIGVLIEWSPLPIPPHVHAMRRFDGTPLYESAPAGGAALDPGRPEVRAFLTSAAAFWLDQYHADGLAVDEGNPALKEIARMAAREHPGTVVTAPEASG